ncbi:MAG: hypothetical protein WC511_05000 [Candidatus Pacearchaeota archaeon]
MEGKKYNSQKQTLSFIKKYWKQIIFIIFLCALGFGLYFLGKYFLGKPFFP